METFEIICINSRYDYRSVDASLPVELNIIVVFIFTFSIVFCHGILAMITIGIIVVIPGIDVVRLYHMTF